MKQTEERILIMRANRGFLAELTCATQTPNIPASIRQSDQKILSQYPALPQTGEFIAPAYSTASQVEHEVTSSRLVKENKSWRNSVTGPLQMQTRLKTLVYTPV